MSEQLRDKLWHYEVAPPPKAWDAICAGLDDQGSSLAERLYQFEQAPNRNAWMQIAKELDATSEEAAPARPFYERYRRPLRYAGIAAVLTVAAILTIFLTIRNTPNNDIAQGRQEQSSMDRAGTTNNEAGSETGDAAPPSGPSKDVPKASDEGDRPSADSRSSNPPLAASPTTRPNSNRYLTVASEEGKPVRLSKKVYPVFDCAEHSTAVKRYRCKEDIEALQQKMAASLASPSGDFASLMDMIKTLEENP